MKGMRFYQ
ncbi:hypothetical protein ACSQ67_014008 [Phaseolus vulgaris]